MRARLSAWAVIAAVMLLAGCASGPKQAPLYEWGQYPTILHEDLKQALPPEQQLKAMEQQRTLIEEAGTPIPPGMSMHMALLHQRLGQHDQAQQYLELEAQRYPSLRAFVTWPQNQGPAGERERLSHVYVALASKGYEVPAPTVVQEVLRDNRVLVQEIPVEKLAEAFGTDAALFVDIDDYGTHYQLVRTVARVHLRGRLVSLKTGRLLWEGKAKWEDVDQDTSSVAALLINALESHVLRDSSNFAYRVAGTAAHLIWNQKLSAGALCPDVGKDGTSCYRPLQ